MFGDAGLSGPPRQSGGLLAISGCSESGAVDGCLANVVHLDVATEGLLFGVAVVRHVTDGLVKVLNDWQDISVHYSLMWE